MLGKDNGASIAVPILIVIAFLVALGVYHTYLAPLFAAPAQDVVDIMPLKH